MGIPLLDLSRQYETIQEELEAAALRVLRSGRYILGPEVEAFERECAAYLGTSDSVGMSSGTDALLAALMALEISPGDEVIVPSYTFFATAGSVARLGARPVFVDVDKDSLCMTAEGVEAALSPRTRAVIAVHLFGRVADIPAIREVLDPRDIPLIEDAAQAIGGRWKGRPAGSLGTLACFSFFPSKNLGALGDGGLVGTDDEDLAARLRKLRNHGQVAAYEHDEVGGNFRLDALQAAMLRVKLPHLDNWTEGRRAVAARYRRLFAELGLEAEVQAPEDDPDRHAYHQFVIRVPAEKREACLEALREKEIGHNVYYRVPLHKQPCFAPQDGAFPVSEDAARRAVALPVFPELREDEQAQVVRVLASVLLS
ncbi:MAG TPA: DegT/DnrJ/EryC1/StrS family aminotransferase [Planctomycetes bacterium]|nr:DegT/DnrJ/EryC1/StrS family aminotransferase [Planctomycetota bacterium]